MKAYTFTQDELTTQYNDAIDAFLTQLRDAEVITSAMYEQLYPYRIVASPPTFFGRWWAKIFRSSWKENAVYFHLVKVITPKECTPASDTDTTKDLERPTYE